MVAGWGNIESERGGGRGDHCPDNARIRRAAVTAAAAPAAVAAAVVVAACSAAPAGEATEANVKLLLLLFVRGLPSADSAHMAQPICTTPSLSPAPHAAHILHISRLPPTPHNQVLLQLLPSCLPGCRYWGQRQAPHLEPLRLLLRCSVFHDGLNGGSIRVISIILWQLIPVGGHHAGGTGEQWQQATGRRGQQAAAAAAGASQGMQRCRT